LYLASFLCSVISTIPSHTLHATISPSSLSSPVVGCPLLFALFVFFFFFQAEDGIRDVAVTGVQTCALPICKWGDYSPKTFFLVIFFAQLFDCKVNDLLEFLRKDQCWRRIICGSDPVPRPSDISNFKRRVGEKRLIPCFQALTGQIMGCMAFAEINYSFVLRHFA